ncbi:hypothetical protein V8F06_006862 [Rhypophila decipiens]
MRGPSASLEQPTILNPSNYRIMTRRLSILDRWTGHPCSSSVPDVMPLLTHHWRHWWHPPEGRRCKDAWLTRFNSWENWGPAVNPDVESSPFYDSRTTESLTSADRLRLESLNVLPGDTTNYHHDNFFVDPADSSQALHRCQCRQKSPARVGGPRLPSASGTGERTTRSIAYVHDKKFRRRSSAMIFGLDLKRPRPDKSRTGFGVHDYFSPSTHRLFRSKGLPLAFASTGYRHLSTLDSRPRNAFPLFSQGSVQVPRGHNLSPNAIRPRQTYDPLKPTDSEPFRAIETEKPDQAQGFRESSVGRDTPTGLGAGHQLPGAGVAASRSTLSGVEVLRAPLKCLQKTIFDP